MVHSDILISGSKTIIYVIKEQSVQAANLSDLRVLLVCVWFFFIEVPVHTTLRLKKVEKWKV